MNNDFYKYDPETLSYRKVDSSFLEGFMRSASFLMLGGIMTATLFYFFSGSLFFSENSELKREKRKLEVQYKVMNKQLQEIKSKLAQVEKRDDKIYRAIYNADPIPDNVRKAGVGGTDRYEHLRGYEKSELMLKTSKKLDQISKSLKVQSRSFKELFALAKEKRSYLNSIPAIQPIPTDEVERIASGFGKRLHPIYNIRKMHTGL
ncbi:MAG: M23 family peptidase, partial [Flavobacteriales bacterium]